MGMTTFHYVYKRNGGFLPYSCPSRCRDEDGKILQFWQPWKTLKAEGGTVGIIILSDWSPDGPFVAVLPTLDGAGVDVEIPTWPDLLDFARHVRDALEIMR